jgi:hypothetical protein
MKSENMKKRRKHFFSAGEGVGVGWMGTSAGRRDLEEKNYQEKIKRESL